MFFQSPKPTSNPNRFEVLRDDIILFFTLSLTANFRDGLLSIVLPLTPTLSGDLDEISLTPKNVYVMFLHAFIFVPQAIFIIGVPLSCIFGFPFPVFLCTPVCLALGLLFVYTNKWFCVLLNGTRGRMIGGGECYAENAYEDVVDWYSKDMDHIGERWVFMNGVAVGSHWLHNNLERLAKTFHRPILGIHNTTNGILFDILECIVQRTFDYRTADIRIAHGVIAKLLADSSITKVVLIAHSQGAIESAMVLDMLYDTMPPQQLGKLEIYTFGNASNHWNCPQDKSGAMIIKHIEHYVNTGDWVSRFGILNVRPLSTPTGSLEVDGPCEVQVVHAKGRDSHKGTLLRSEERGRTGEQFEGRMFLRKATGHQLNQHYLDNMFPLDQKRVQVLEKDAELSMRHWFTSDGGIADKSMSGGPVGAMGAQRVKDRSRLWQYINGHTPDRKQAA